MRWTRVCPLLGAALASCAVEENEFPIPSALSDAGDGGSGGGSAGSFTSAGAPSHEGGRSGSGTAGSLGASGSSSFAGTFGMAGNGGVAGANGGAAGAGGKGNGGSAGTGGRANGGAGGKGNGGSSGAGGGASTQCSGVNIPAKNTWKATAMPAAAGDPAARAIDGDPATRFSTGAAQAGGEWLQVDFGASITLNEVRLQTPNNDFSRHYQVRLSDKSQDFAAAILKEGNGMTGTITVSLPQTHKGRYLTIRQTGTAMPDWWSLFEVDVDCN